MQCTPYTKNLCSPKIFLNIKALCLYSKCAFYIVQIEFPHLFANINIPKMRIGYLDFSEKDIALQRKSFAVVL